MALDCYAILDGIPVASSLRPVVQADPFLPRSSVQFPFVAKGNLSKIICDSKEEETTSRNESALRQTAAQLNRVVSLRSEVMKCSINQLRCRR